MDILSVLDKKKNNIELSEQEIRFVVNGYVKEEIPDYQISSLLMAIRLNGMSEKETAFLTIAMIDSGEIIEYNNLGKLIVDKHSTGGIGDKTSLVLIPLLASLDFAVSKMSGRGLGYTGGTIDKLEAISNVSTDLSKEQIMNQVNNVGCVISAQTDDIVPADKKLYALRDVTSTVDSIPLIASSIMSKKIALGADIIILDVKYGIGAFMKTKEEAQLLAKAMCSIGEKLKRKTIAIISSMNQPLGYTVGNALEVQEAIHTLLGIEGQNDELKEICSEIAYQFMHERDKHLSDEEIYSKIEESFTSKKAYDKFSKMIKAQGADNQSIENLNISSNSYQIRAEKSGFLSRLNALDIGKAAMILGAGRQVKEDTIDLSVGIYLNKKVGDEVDKGDVIMDIRYNDINKLEKSISYAKEAIEISHERINKVLVIEKSIR